MALRPSTLAVSLAAALAAAALPARAGPELVPYPKDKGMLYGTVDRADNKQVRELYAPKAAIDAVKAGKPLPEGTAITMLLYKAKLDDKGAPAKGAGGGFEKGDPIAHFVMQKSKGWGAGYAADMRNGEWEYRAFTPAGTPNEKADLKPCFTCHKPKSDQDYVFSLPRMKEAK